MREVETFYPKKVLDQKYKSPYGNTFREYRNKLELNERLLFNSGQHIHEVEAKYLD